mgnify:CR=1 FL=1
MNVPYLPSISSVSQPSLESITDAGDQQQLREEHTARPPEDSDIKALNAFLELLPTRTHHLQHEILESRQSTRNDGLPGMFIPKRELRRIITIEAVTRELKETLAPPPLRMSLNEIQAYAKTVCTEPEEEKGGKTKIKSFRKIFALLMIVEVPASIIAFIQENVSDQDLPLTLVKKGMTRLLYRRGDRKKQTPLQCFKDERQWSPMKCENFCEKQWCLLAPFFSPPDADGVVKNYILQDRHILPFLTLEDAPGHGVDKTGGSGRVKIVGIHPDHHNFNDSRLCSRGFAIKQQIYDDDRESYKSEIKILTKFSGTHNHPHIVSLLATYEQFNRFHLIFYRAEGDLFEYWKKLKPHTDLTHSNVKWFAAQCKGLADGLSRLHRLGPLAKPPVRSQQQRTESMTGKLFPMMGMQGDEYIFL